MMFTWVEEEARDTISTPKVPKGRLNPSSQVHRLYKQSKGVKTSKHWVLPQGFNLLAA